MRVTVPLQLAAIFAIMLPSMGDYVGTGKTISLFNFELWAHHILGLIVIVCWIYINLVSLRVIKFRAWYIPAMRLALVSWIISMGTGFRLYLEIWW